MKVITVASTFPTSDTDPVPAFVRDQLIAIKKLRPELQIVVLAPHDARSGTAKFTRHDAYDEYRFHYFWPFVAERLAGRGILAALAANPLNYLLIPCLFLGEFLALLTLTKRLQPDVIYAHWFTPQGVVASWVARITGTPYVFTTHASDVAVWRKIPFFGRHVVRSSTIHARGFTAVSSASMEKLRQFFTVEEWLNLRSNSAIISMGVDLPDSPPRLPDDNDGTVILFLGRLVEKKGVQFLLSAYAAARDGLGRSRMVIAGDGPMLASLERQAARLGLCENVRFAGFVSGPEKTRLLREATLYVVPSIVTEDGDAEGMPVSLMEGLAHAKICIATTESGANDVLTAGHNGFIVPEKNVEALSGALLEAAGLKPAQRRAMQEAARETARRFEWPTIARQYVEFLFKAFRAG